MSALKELEKAWRVLATGFCFALFGVGSFLLSFFWFRWIFLMNRDPKQRQMIARRHISAAFRFFLNTAQRIGALEYRIEGVEKLTNDQGCLLLANHPTLIDYVLITSVMPQAECIAKAELLKNPFLSGAVSAAGYLINSAGDELVRQCAQRLNEGGVIVIFPEGTRTEVGQYPKLQRGAANIAVRTESEMRLVQIYCTETLLRKGSRWYKVPARKPVFIVKVLDRLSPQPFIDEAQAIPSLAARRLNQFLSEQLIPDQERLLDYGTTQK